MESVGMVTVDQGDEQVMFIDEDSNEGDNRELRNSATLSENSGNKGLN